MDWLASFFTSGLAQFAMAAWTGALTQEQQKKYEAFVEQQILEGRSVADARTRAAMGMIAEDPNTNAAQAVFKAMNVDLPKSAFANVSKTVAAGNKRRTDFLKSYDASTGAYLSQNDAATSGFLGDLSQQSAGLTGEYGKREADVMALLAGQGDQALKDTQRTFGEQSAAALGDLTARGLSGSGVGASVRGGFATRESDQLARIREDVGRQKADATARLRGDTLSFGERAMGLGAQYRNEGINRSLGGRERALANRAGWDIGLSGDTQAARERALTQAYGIAQDTGNKYGAFLTDRGRYDSDIFLGTTGDYLNMIMGINNVPPDRSSSNNMMSLAGQGLGR